MERTTVSDFLIQELYKIGIKDFFGVPGDFAFNIIESVENFPGANWVGCTNELNAGYAADGYARAKGYGALVTTYNVGELSAMNAIAGSYAENVPVICVAGLPPEKHIRKKTLLHHNFLKPNYYAASDAFAQVVQAGAILNAGNAKYEIERILGEFIREKKPVYIGIPTDVCKAFIKNDPDIKMPESDYKKLEKAAAHILKLIENACDPVILGDVLVDRFCAACEFQRFVKNSGIPATTLLMGKGLINESEPNFLGTFTGKDTEVCDALNRSDCVICIGAVLSDFNTARFSLNFNPQEFVDINGTYTVAAGQVYENVLMNDILYKIANQIKPRLTQITRPKPVLAEITEEKPLDFEYLILRFERFMQAGDYLVTETGLANFIPASLNFPDNCRLFSQLLWASIGWAAPACFGAAIANPTKRIILLTGEGSHQVSVQTLSDMVYRDVRPVIFVLKNGGYAIERLLSHDFDNKFNDINCWEYTKLFDVFGGDVYTAKARTNVEFDRVLNRIGAEKRLCYVELHMDKADIPPFFKKMFT
ncbi:MAG: hypothetical protein LBJ74_01770 [Heliobacteriaceae bacterium]|jgi:indolepyruvate decarboxylase|nr:hypothetical protein [Heliobacteriaceae bacterium]